MMSITKLYLSYLAINIINTQAATSHPESAKLESEQHAAHCQVNLTMDLRHA